MSSVMVSLFQRTIVAHRMEVLNDGRILIADEHYRKDGRVDRHCSYYSINGQRISAARYKALRGGAVDGLSTLGTTSADWRCSIDGASVDGVRWLHRVVNQGYAVITAAKTAREVVRHA